MSKREDGQFATWVEELKKQVEPDEMPAFEAWAQTKSAKEAYRGYLRESEFHRKYNELQQEAQEVESLKEELDAWYEQEAPKNKALLAERDALKAQLEELGAGGPPPADASHGPGLSQDEIAEMKEKLVKLDALDQLIPAVLADMGKVIQDSIKNNFEIDPREVIQLSLKQRQPPWKAYEILTATERQKRYEEEQEAQRKKWFEEGRRAALTNNSPDHLQSSGPSVVDYLQQLNKEAVKPADKTDRINAAMKEFVEGNFS